MRPLSKERLALYQRLESQVRKTPMYELTNIPIPNKCRIFCKGEHRQPTGSHYDRQTVRLLRGFEEDRGLISPGGKPLVETTTGSSGASFAWMCRVLGYECTVFIPKDMPSARIEQIRSFGATIHETPAKLYIGGLVKEFQSFILDRTNSMRYVAPNHSFDTKYAPAAMRDLANEMLEDLQAIGVGAPNYFVAALGNGISARGVAEVLIPNGTKLIGMEPHESPTVLRTQFPDRYTELYPHGTVNERHQVYGTGAGKDAGISFPNVNIIAPSISEIRLPTQEAWKNTQRLLMDCEAMHVGNSSAACVAAALDLARTADPGSTILTILYDASWRYLPICDGWSNE